MSTIKYKTLKLAEAPDYDYVSVKQNDSNGVELQLTLKNANDTDYTPLPGTLALLHMCTDKGVEINLSGTISGNVAAVTLSSNSLATAGVIASELILSEDGVSITTQTFYLRVHPAVDAMDTIQSAEYHGLSEILAACTGDWSVLYKTATLTIPVSAWSTEDDVNYTATSNCEYVDSTTHEIVVPSSSSYMHCNQCQVRPLSKVDGQIQFVAASLPGVALTMNVMVFNPVLGG